jgi:hypothetical protein
MDFGHFFFIRREPKRSALIVFNIRREFVNELLPQRAREMGERELSIRIVHDNNVTHAGGGGAASDWSAIQDENLQTGAGTFSSARSADDSSADDNEIVRLGHGAQNCRV